MQCLIQSETLKIIFQNKSHFYDSGLKSCLKYMSNLNILPSCFIFLCFLLASKCYKHKSKKLDMEQNFETVAEDRLRRTRLLQLAQQLRTLVREIRIVDVEIRKVSLKITEKLQSQKDYFTKKGQQDPELKKDPEFKLLMNWLENFSAFYKISQNPQGQVCKIILQILIKVAGDLEGFGYIQIVQLGPELRQLAATSQTAKLKKEIQENTKQALDFRFRLGLNYLKCREALKALQQIQSEINTSSKLFERKNTRFLGGILKSIVWDDHINDIIAKLVPVTEERIETTLIERDFKSCYLDFEVEHPKVVKLVVSNPEKMKARQALKQQMTEKVRIQMEKEAANKNTKMIEFAGEKLMVSQTVFAYWEVYHKDQKKN